MLPPLEYNIKIVAISFQKELVNICLMLENLLFQETNGIVAMLLFEFLHFII